MTEKPELRDVELMGLLSSGDEAAFVELYRRHQGALFRFALHMSGRPEAAADVVQETFMTLIRQSAKFDPGKGTPGAFLYGIARNHLHKMHDRESRYVPYAGEMDERGGPGSPDSLPANANGASSWHPSGNTSPVSVLVDMEQAEIVDCVRDAVLTLPEHYRAPITLCDLEGKSYGEAAAILECPVGTVRSRLNRARSILLEKLRPARLAGRVLGASTGGKE
jgi:RNA polymerase sigma-70 factor (ECF subfamily)